MQRTITLTDKQEEILTVFSKQTGRSIEELIFNFLDGWIGQLEEQVDGGKSREPDNVEQMDFGNEGNK